MKLEYLNSDNIPCKKRGSVSNEHAPIKKNWFSIEMRNRSRASLKSIVLHLHGKNCILFSIFHPHHNDFMSSTFNMQKVPETCIVSASYCTFYIHILHSWQDNLNEFMIAIPFYFYSYFFLSNSKQNLTKQKWEWSEKKQQVRKEGRVVKWELNEKKKKCLHICSLTLCHKLFTYK